MRRFAAILLLVVSLPAIAQEPLPLPPKNSVVPPATISARVGDIIAITPEGKNSFVWDKTAFPLGTRAILDGQKLYLTASVAGKYTVTLVNLGDGTQTERVVIVTNGPEPPVPVPVPVPVDQLKEITAALTDLQKRVAALEGSKPPPFALSHVTFIGPELTAESRAVNADKGLRKFLKDGGVELHVLLSGDAEIEAARMTKYVVAAGGAPCAILQDKEGKVIAQYPLRSSQAIQTLCAQFMGK